MPQQTLQLMYSLCLFLFISSVVAQPKKIKKVTKEMLEETQHPNYKEASASIIYQSGSKKLDFKEGFFFENKFHQIVKFYNKRGFSYATFSIPIRKNSQRQESKILELKLTTYNLENGKIAKQSIRSNEGYYIDKKGRREFVITAPNLKEGTVVEIEYTFLEFRLTYTEFWPFQQQIPVRSSVLSFEVPDFVQFKEIIKPLDQVQTSSDSRRQKIASTALAGGGGFGNMFELKLNKRSYWTSNLPPLEKDDFSGTYNDYLVGVQHNLIAITPPNYQLHRFFSTSWDDLASYVSENDYFGNRAKEWDDFLEANPVFIVEETLSEEEKIKEILRHVQQHMRDNEKYEVVSAEALSNIYNAKLGNATQINLILTGLLRANGIQANSILLGTKEMGKVKEPTIGQLNKSISIAYVGNETYLLDASSPYTWLNIIHPDNFNGTSIELRTTDDFKLHELRPQGISQQNVSIRYAFQENNQYQGSLHHEWTKYEALIARESASTEDGTTIKRLNKNAVIELDYTKAKLENEDPYRLQFNANFDTNISLSTENKFTTISLFDVFKKSLENPFSSNERQIPVFYPFPQYHTYEVYFEIPETHRVESMPENRKITLPDFAGNLNITYTKEESGVKAKMVFQINKTEIPPKRYKQIFALYQMKEEALNDVILLEKIK